MRGIDYRPRTIDRAIFAILGLLHIANGLYLVGPWYLDETESGKAPLISLFNSDEAVVIYGTLLLLDGVALLYTGLAKKYSRRYTKILSNALLFGFLLRLYALIGVLLIIDSWRPPSYLSQMASVSILAAYWIWVRVRARTTEFIR